MTLTLRDPKAIEMARQLASLRGVSEVEAVTAALEGELERAMAKRPLRETLAEIARDLAAKAGPDRHTMTKEEIDAMWER